MFVLVLFIVGIVACFFLAKAILKFVPRKVQPVISILLYIIAGILIWMTYTSVMTPIKFNQEKEVRYGAVINNLKIIRDAQNAHRTVTGKYCAKGEDLVKFIDTAKLAVTTARNETKTVNIGGGMTNEVEYRVIDTTGYTDVRATFVGKDYKKMMDVPFTNTQFTLSLGEIARTNGIMAAVYEVKVAKEVVLNGMNEDLIRLDEEAFADNEVKGKFISVGSINEVSDKGNWPPTYDQAEINKKK
jgi:energy-coupling factor transporter transmembrane protein EcfT